MTQLFYQFWWLIFPVLGMLIGLVSIIGGFRSRDKTLKMIEKFIDQGKEPPEALLALLRDDPDRSQNGDSRQYGFVPAIPMIAVAAGFAYFGWRSDHEVFIMLAIVFSIMGLGFLLMALFNRPKG